LTDGRLQVFAGRVVCDDEARVVAAGGAVAQGLVAVPRQQAERLAAMEAGG